MTPVINSPPPVDARRAQPHHELDPAAINAVLERHWWGLLATSVDNRPYAVPVAYGWNGTHVYIAALDGRKIRNLQANPFACLTVTDVDSGSDWDSVVMEGEVEWVKRPGQLITAFDALARQCRRPVVMPSPSRLLAARVFRIAPVSMTGRSRRSDAVGADGARAWQGRRG